ncbi:hypothetical protein ACUJ46_09100 [Sandaracinobacteroides sp. A072]|uniref:hypothetical protein n=1 Tax=Sandaracinobacteroides sp. A072 TaxID=3461146 RepID=UPI004042C2DC
MSFRSSGCRITLYPLTIMLIAGCSPDGQESAASPAAQSSNVSEGAAGINGQAEGTRINGTVDGQPVSWSLWTMQSDFTGDASNGTVSVMARKVSGPDDIGNLAFGFEFSGGQPNNAEITLDNGEGKRSFYLLSSSRSPVTLNKLEKSGEQMHLSGSVSAILGYSQDMGRNIDDSKSHAVDLTFDIELDNLSQ